MILSDFHVHTTYCDGKSTPREIAEEAVSLGMTRLGFSGHGYTWFDESYCMSKAGADAYISEIAALKEEYSGRIAILCGVEQDYYSDEPTDRYDYVIGSVHYLRLKGKYVPIDKSREILMCAAREYFGGDIIALAEEYYRTVSDVVRKTHADIIGHFDLITLFNEGEALFDERDPRYIRAWRSATDSLLTYNVPFEINTGAISRGYKSSPYPSYDIVRYLKEKGARLILSSDSHKKDTLCFAFNKYAYLLE